MFDQNYNPYVIEVNADPFTLTNSAATKEGVERTF